MARPGSFGRQVPPSSVLSDPQGPYHGVHNGATRMDRLLLRKEQRTSLAPPKAPKFAAPRFKAPRAPRMRMK